MALAKKLQEEDEAAQVEEAQMLKDAAEEPKPQGEPISKFVKQDLVKQIMEMGFSLHATEKALFMTMSKGQSIEGALEWLGEHSEDPDFNEQLFMVGQEGEGELKKEY